MRYRQLLEAVRSKRPRAILEVGTWNGTRAIEMLNLAPDAVYYGFDLFETADSTTDRDELNVKPHYTMDYVYDKLAGFNVQLHRGNTRETLKNFAAPVDFVWLDGGHSVETIASDWLNIKRLLTADAWVFMDDYYTGPIDIERFGCNKLVETLRHEILPDMDPVSGGGWVSMVRVYP